jgi:hypothetical protein
LESVALGKQHDSHLYRLAEKDITMVKFNKHRQNTTVTIHANSPMAKPKAMNIRRILLDPPPVSLPKPSKTKIFGTLFHLLKRKLQVKDKGERVVMEVDKDMEVDMDMEEEDYPDTEEDSFRTVIDE